MTDQPTSFEIVANLRREFAGTQRVNPFSHMIEAICGVTMLDPASPIPSRNARMRIALVSMPAPELLPVEVLSSVRIDPPPEDVDVKACKRALVTFDRSTAARMLETFEEALRHAMGFSPDVICFNELGMPSSDMVPMPEAIELAWKASQDSGSLIIAGSAHDQRTLYNTGYLFRPGGPRTAETFHKTLSARSVGELISAPASRRVLALPFAGMRIAIMICLDIADYASIASVVKVGDGVDLLLVPCFTPKFDDMVSIARVTSRALPGVVALVNAVLPDTSAKECQVAAFGRLQAATATSVTTSGAVVSIVEIDRADFQQERIKLKTARDESTRELEFLFGRRDMPSVAP